VNRVAPGEHDNWLAPLYFTGKRKNGGYTLIPPLLTYTSTDGYGGFNLIGPMFCSWKGGSKCDARTAQDIDFGVAPFYFYGQDAETKYETIYKGYADLLMKGQPLPNITIGGYDKDMVQSTAFGAGATEKARNAAQARIAELRAGAPIFGGTVRDNEGKVVLNGIKGLYDPALEKMPYVVEGVVGSVR